MANNHTILESATGSAFKSTDTAGVKTPHSAIAKADGTPLDVITPSDTQANPTNALRTSSALSIWDGTQWTRLKQAVTGTITSLVGIINVVNLGRYNATQPTLTDGDWRSAQYNSRAELLVALSILGTQATIKAASTAAVATDTAIVVTNRDYVLRGTATDRSGTSSATLNQWTQVFPPNANRVLWEFQNPPDSKVFMELGFGAADASPGTSATRFVILAPGDPYGEAAPGQPVNTDRISVRVPSTASIVYVAREM